MGRGGAGIERAPQRTTGAQEAHPEATHGNAERGSSFGWAKSVRTNEPEDFTVLAREQGDGPLDVFGRARRVDALFEPRDVVSREPIAEPEVADVLLARLALAELCPLPASDADQPGICVATACVESRRRADRREEGRSDKVRDVSWLGAAADCVANDRLSVAAIELVEVGGIRLKTGGELGIGAFGHSKYFRARRCALHVSMDASGSP